MDLDDGGQGRRLLVIRIAIDVNLASISFPMVWYPMVQTLVFLPSRRW